VPWKGDGVKNFTRASRASGSDRRRVSEMVFGYGRFAPRLIARRRAARDRRNSSFALAKGGL
jgi:hypothetical protein